MITCAVQFRLDVVSDPSVCRRARPRPVICPLPSPPGYLYADFGALPLTELHNFQILQFVHKLPQIFSTYFTKNSMFHTYKTRTKEGLHIDFIRSSLGQRCIEYKGSVLWNLRPDELRNVESTKSFRNKLKQFCIVSSVNV